MPSHYDETSFEYRGHTFVARFYTDDDFTPPWKQEDGHGPVSDWTRRAKYPGERILHKDGGSFRYYDFQEAIKIAKRDGWDAPPYGTGTRGERAARAVERDFERLRAWCNDEWFYCGISVTMATEDCGFDESREYDFALWGLNSDDTEYHKEVMAELAAEALKEHDKALTVAARDLEAARPDMYQAGV